jgi:hypothetical protein
MGIWLMKESEEELLMMNFEQILNFITEKPKIMLSGVNTQKSQSENDTRHLYFKLKEASKDHSQKFLI